MQNTAGRSMSYQWYMACAWGYEPLAGMQPMMKIVKGPTLATQGSDKSIQYFSSVVELKIMDTYTTTKKYFGILQLYKAQTL